jgi:hypothetical protein
LFVPGNSAESGLGRPMAVAGKSQYYACSGELRWTVSRSNTGSTGT